MLVLCACLRVCVRERVCVMHTFTDHLLGYCTVYFSLSAKLISGNPTLHTWHVQFFYAAIRITWCDFPFTDSCMTSLLYIYILYFTSYVSSPHVPRSPLPPILQPARLSQRVFLGRAARGLIGETFMPLWHRWQQVKGRGGVKTMKRGGREEWEKRGWNRKRGRQTETERGGKWR